MLMLHTASSTSSRRRSVRARTIGQGATTRSIPAQGNLRTNTRCTGGMSLRMAPVRNGSAHGGGGACMRGPPRLTMRAGDRRRYQSESSGQTPNGIIQPQEASGGDTASRRAPVRRAAAPPSRSRPGNEVCITTFKGLPRAPSRLKRADDHASVARGGPLGRAGRSCRPRHTHGLYGKLRKACARRR